MPELFVHSIQSLFRLGIRLPGVGCPFAKCYFYSSEESYDGQRREGEAGGGGVGGYEGVFPSQRLDWLKRGRRRSQGKFNLSLRCTRCFLCRDLIGEGSVEAGPVQIWFCHSDKHPFC